MSCSDGQMSASSLPYPILDDIDLDRIGPLSAPTHQNLAAAPASERLDRATDPEAADQLDWVEAFDPDPMKTLFQTGGDRRW